MGILVKYTGPKAIHSSGVDVGVQAVHLDLDGDAVELDDDVANDLCKGQPQAFKKYQKTAPKKADETFEKGDK